MADITRAHGPDDPDRCQGVMKFGQCDNKSMEGSTFCAVHGGNKAVQATEAKSLRNYRVAKWQARLDRMTDAPQIKSLRDEVGILRMILEERLNQCQTDMDLVLYSHQIAHLVEKIEKVVVSCDKLEEKLHVVIDRQQLLQFASQVINIVGAHTTEEMLTIISDEILQAIGKLGGDDVE